MLALAIGYLTAAFMFADLGWPDQPWIAEPSGRAFVVFSAYATACAGYLISWLYD